MATFELSIRDRNPLTFLVRIPDENAPLVRDPETGEEERDYGNADWPTDEEVSAEASRVLGRPVVVRVDPADDICEGLGRPVECSVCGCHLAAFPAGSDQIGPAHDGAACVGCAAVSRGIEDDDAPLCPCGAHGCA